MPLQMLLQYDVYNSTLKKQHSAIPSQQFNYQSKLTVKSLCHLQCIAPSVYKDLEGAWHLLRRQHHATLFYYELPFYFRVFSKPN